MTKLASLLQIHPGEGRIVGFLIAVFLLPNLGGAIGAPGVEALFFSRFGTEFLPYMYLALGVLALLVSLFLGAMLERLSKKRLYTALPFLLAVTLIISRFVVSLDLNWFYPVLWLWMALLWTLQALFIWGLAGLVCDTRQAKRLFPLFGASAILGGAMGGLITQPLVKVLGTENLLLVWSAMLFVSFVFVSILLRGYAERHHASWRKPPGLLDGVRKGYDYVRKTALLRWFSLAAFLFSILYFSVSFPFYSSVANQFPAEDDLAGFLGLFMGAMTILAFIVSLLIANRFYAKFGFISAVLIFPLIYFLGFSGLLFTASFAFLSAFRFLQIVWLKGMSDTAYQSIFNIVPESQRDQTRTFIRGFPEQIGVSVTGLILIIGATILDQQEMFLIAIVAALITVFAVWRAGKAYQAALVGALEAGQPHVFYGEDLSFGGFVQEAGAVDVVINGIHSERAGVRQVSAEILGNLAVPSATKALVYALDDEVPEVRGATLRALSNANAAAALLEVASCLNDVVPAVRLEAIKALLHLANYPKGIKIHLAPLLEDEYPKIRAQVAVALLGFGDHPQAKSLLLEMGSAPDVGTRVAALEAYAAWGDPSCYSIAEKALRDNHSLVRKSAVRAVARIDPDRSMDTLIASLGDVDVSVREEIACRLSKMGPFVADQLVTALDNPSIESGALMALAEMPQAPHPPIKAYVDRKVKQSNYYSALANGVNQHLDSDRFLPLMADALRYGAKQQATHALLGLGLLEDSAAMAVGIENLNSENPGQRANALEMIDSLRNRDLIHGLLSLWERDALETGLPVQENTPSLQDLLVQILDSPDDWLQACALLCALGEKDQRIAARLADLAASDDSFLAETAKYVQNGGKMDTLSTIPIMERILYLQKVPLFEKLPPSDLKQVAAILDEHLFEDGDVIADEGEIGDEMYIIVSGEVDVQVEESGATKSLIKRQAGEYVGEMAVISHEPRMATLVAVGNVRVLVLEQKSFEGMLRERPSISLAVMRELISRLKEQH